MALYALLYGDHWRWRGRYTHEGSGRVRARLLQAGVISPDFSLELTGFFPGKHLLHFLVLKMKDF